MSVTGANQDLVALKKLLTSWNVGILFDLFKEEDITINELVMMNYSHIHSLLKDYKTGVKIRFEYNLKNWRQELGVPLKTWDTSPYSICCCTNKKYFENNITENNHYKDTNGLRSDIESGAIQKDCMQDNHAPLSPQSVYSNNSLINMLHSDDVFQFGPTPESAKDKTHNTSNELDMDNVPLQALGEILSNSDNVPPKFPSKSTPEQHTVHLKKILKKSGTRGATILKFYAEKDRLTNVHRSQLIQLIVDYFIENNYHLSLNLSHNLEWEIIKMFPTEKLEYYRTEKRGKIYAKFSNVKRYKRDRILKSVTESDTQHSSIRRSRQKTEEDETNNFVQQDDNDWYPTAEPEILVKEEADVGNV